MFYQSQLETLYEPSKISRLSQERLSESFVELDRKIKPDGVSRQLIIESLPQLAEGDDAKELEQFKDKFLKESGF